MRNLSRQIGNNLQCSACQLTSIIVLYKGVFVSMYDMYIHYRNICGYRCRIKVKQYTCTLGQFELCIYYIVYIILYCIYYIDLY